MMKHLLSKSLLLLLCFSPLACSSTRTERLNLPEPQVVSKVDLKKYSGLWYEIARLPNRFQKKCVGSTAAYTSLPSGKIRVLNTCRKETLDGKLKTIEGSAKVVDEDTNAKLKVSFFWPFKGDYWILELADDYSYAVVGAPSRDYLWILARTPQMKEEIYKMLLTKIEKQGFDTHALLRSPQPKIAE